MEDAFGEWESRVPTSPRPCSLPPEGIARWHNWVLGIGLLDSRLNRLNRGLGEMISGSLLGYKLSIKHRRRESIAA